ncbi:MAG: hypothetical protein ACP5XB_26215 [Isosphaeraceae bacterium]
MKRTRRTSLFSLSVLLVSFISFLPGCAQPDNPTPKAAPPPPAPKPEELVMPKVQGKTYNPTANPHYKQMQDQFAKQAGAH